jgi:hypothetical protein
LIEQQIHLNIEGENSDGNLASNDAYLYFNENNDQKKFHVKLKKKVVIN